MDQDQTSPTAPLCTKCGQHTAGFKCDMCGAQSDEHDDKHPCGGDHCVAKCVACNEAETKCTCLPTTASTE